MQRNGLRHMVSSAKNQVWCLAKNGAGESRHPLIISLVRCLQESFSRNTSRTHF